MITLWIVIIFLILFIAGLLNSINTELRRRIYAALKPGDRRYFLTENREECWAKVLDIKNGIVTYGIGEHRGKELILKLSLEEFMHVYDKGV